MNDMFVFAEDAEEETGQSGEAAHRTWKVAIVDDDESIHHVTKLALNGFDFEGGNLELIDAYSGAEAKELFHQHNDIALVLLDVVMEDEQAGLSVVKYIRETIRNDRVRIVLRTGQPGQAPEKQVIRQYDINDYKEKTDLTASKLDTLLYSCLRSYRDIVALDQSRAGLERVINATKNMFEKQFLDEFARGVLEQLTSILHVDQDAFFGNCNGLAAQEEEGRFRIVAGTGRFEQAVGDCAVEKCFLPAGLTDRLTTMESGTVYDDGHFLAVSASQDGRRNVLYLSGLERTDDLSLHLIGLFSQNVLVAFDNLHLREEVMDTQREVVYRLGEAVETRSRETGNHVKRVAEMSKLLALASGAELRWAETLKHASPMHDLGKIGVPDAILNKPGKLEPHEWEVMKTHANIGYDILHTSKRDILKMGALLSQQHHEKWDGSGYPSGLAGESIALEARITAVADVFDALASDRCYKKAWPLDDVYEFMRDQAGRHFDPDLVDLLFANIDEVNRIRSRYADKFESE